MQPEFPQKALPLGELARERLRGQARHDRAAAQRQVISLSERPYPTGPASLSASLPSPSLLRNATARVAAPSVCFAVACILLAAASTAPPCFRRWRWSSPLLPKGEAFALSPYTKRGPDKNVRPSLRSVLIPPWSRALPQLPALQPVLRALLLRGQQASPRASGDTDRPSAGRG